MVKVSLFLIFLLLLLPASLTRSMSRDASSESFFFRPKDDGPIFDPDRPDQEGEKSGEARSERRIVKISAEIIVTEGVKDRD